MKQIISNDYTVLDENVDSQMTLVLGAPCTDGVVLIGDRKMTSYGTLGIQHPFGDKITGELDGVLTGFAGDARAFQVFVSALKDYVTKTRDEHFKYLLNNPLIGHNIGPSFEQVKLKVSQLLNEFYSKNKEFKYNVLMGVSSKYSDNKSSLYYFEADGRFSTLPEPKAIGSGSSYVYYFLKNYWHSGKTTMKEFAQLGDFLIKYVSHDKITLDHAVGLSSDQPYPQIVFIPDNSDFCCPYNNGNPKLDCTPTQQELEQFKDYSEQKLNELHSQPFF